MATRTKTTSQQQQQVPKELPKDNFVFALFSYLQERLGHYCSYCVSCQAPHSCWNPTGGVVCASPLCVFRLEGSPLNDLVEVRQCPFADCHKLDLSSVGKEFLGMELRTLSEKYHISGPMLLEMMLHKYLPPEQMKRFLVDGLGKVRTATVKSVINPVLCARFEHAWKELREKRPEMQIVPSVAYHGTSTEGVKGISQTGFLLSKLAANTGNRGFYGAGIYCSQHIQTAMAYCRVGAQLLVCAVLMGKIKKVQPCTGAPCAEGYDSHEDPSGNEWVVFKEEYILPTYVVEFTR